MENKDINFDSLAKRSRVTALITLLGALLTLGALLYSSFELRSLNNQVDFKKQEVQSLETRAISLESTLADFEHQVSNLRRTQEDILDFLYNVSSSDNIELFDEGVDWSVLKERIIKMPPGNRKQAILLSLLYAWKDIPFNLGGESVRSGFDSPRFIQRVLSDIGVQIINEPGVPLSNSIMSQLEQISTPEPGDLVFYRGQIGHFGFILLAIGDTESDMVGVGTLQRVHPLQIVRLDRINTPFFPLVGYFRVIYPDE